MAADITSASPSATFVEIKAEVHKRKTSSLSAWCSAHWKPILAEFLSTTSLLFFGCMSIIPIDGFPHSTFHGPIGFGLIVMMNIQIFGHLSGAHMNPAVTLCAVILGSTSITLGMFYVAAQILGASIGYGMLVALTPIDMIVNGICVTRPHPGLNAFQVFGIEVLLTGTLCFLFCAVCDPVHKNKQDSTPIKFGLAVVGLSLVGGRLTDASMNPARSLGPAIWTGLWTLHWTYWAGPIVGSILTTAVYKYIYLQNVK